MAKEMKIHQQKAESPLNAKKVLRIENINNK
jgi:hypothetical protein